MILENALPLTIHQDWSRLRRLYARVQTLCLEGFFDSTKTYVESTKSLAFDLGNFGRMSCNDYITKNQWWILIGPIVENTLPWMKTLRTLTEKSGLVLASCGYHCHDGDIGSHVDGKEGYDLKYSRSQCNLNFVIDRQDVTAKSCFELEDGVHYYIGEPNHCYLLDSGVNHWVINSGMREMFQIRFHSDYTAVKSFFENNPMVLS